MTKELSEEEWKKLFSEPSASKTLDNDTPALHPGPFSLSKEKMREFAVDNFMLHPVMQLLCSYALPPRYTLIGLKDHLFHGCCDTAMVMSLEPLLVAAYAGELDAVAILAFPQKFIEEYNLEIGSRLITVNLYQVPHNKPTDLELDAGALGRYVDFMPFIADFLTDDAERVETIKQAVFDEEDWERTRFLGVWYLKKRPDYYRWGAPMYCALKAKKRKPWKTGST